VIHEQTRPHAHFFLLGVWLFAGATNTFARVVKDDCLKPEVNSDEQYKSDADNHSMFSTLTLNTSSKGCISFSLNTNYIFINGVGHVLEMLQHIQAVNFAKSGIICLAFDQNISFLCKHYVVSPEQRNQVHNF
jgi:hypothetical protein